MATKSDHESNKGHSQTTDHRRHADKQHASDSSLDTHESKGQQTGTHNRQDDKSRGHSGKRRLLL